MTRARFHETFQPLCKVTLNLVFVTKTFFPDGKVGSVVMKFSSVVSTQGPFPPPLRSPDIKEILYVKRGGCERPRQSSFSVSIGDVIKSDEKVKK